MPGPIRIGGRAALPPRARRAAPAAAALALALLAATLGGCYAPQLVLLKSGLDSLRAQVDTMAVRDSATYRLVEDTRKDIADQRAVLLSTRATTGSSSQELADQMSRLQGKLDEAIGRFNQLAMRGALTPPAAPGAAAAGDPQQIYDQAAQDLTQGRYGMALQEFRDVVRRFPTSPQADNAQYGVGECFFAQALFDSAAVEYRRVETGWPQGEKVPAALYKLALAEDKLGHADESKKTFEDLVKRYPLSGEAQLARERLGLPKRH